MARSRRQQKAVDEIETAALSISKAMSDDVHKGDLEPAAVVKQARSRLYKTELTDELIKKIIEGLRDGLYISHAISYAMVNKATLYRWFKRGEEALELVAEAGDARGIKALGLSTLDEQCMVLQLSKLYAEACLAKLCTKQLLNPLEKSWQRYSALLERRFPQLYSMWEHNMAAREPTETITGELQSSKGMSAESVRLFRERILGVKPDVK